MVWMTAEYAPGAVDLFGDNDAREQMGQGHGGQRQHMFGTAPGPVVESRHAANEQGDIATGLTPRGKQFRHVFAADGSTAPIEYDGDLPRTNRCEQTFFVRLTAARRYNGQLQGTVGR